MLLKRRLRFRNLISMGKIKELIKELNDLQEAYDIAMKEIARLRKLLGYDTSKN